MGSQQDAFHRARQMRQHQSQQGRLAEQARAMAVTAPPIDRFGVPLTPKDLVLYRPPMDLIFRVEDVKPVVDPRAPPGMVTLVLSVVTTVHVPAGQPQINMVVVGVAEEQPADPPADPPSALVDDAGRAVSATPQADGDGS